MKEFVGIVGIGCIVGSEGIDQEIILHEFTGACANCFFELRERGIIGL